jgi:SagB-type dehydrogenase family enzyme
MRSTIQEHRNFLKDSLRLTINFELTNQNKGIPAPPLQKPHHSSQRVISLSSPKEWPAEFDISLRSAITRRKSRRTFKQESLSMDELSFLLWATQGLRQQINESTAYRMVPSAGCRHCFETYLAVSNVQNLTPGVYRYLPVQHRLVFENDNNQSGFLSEAALNQSFIEKAPVTFIWTCIPYRMEWRYDLSAHRVIAMDVGHVCQNLYLACEAIQAGTCAIAAFHQQKMDQLVGVDGDDEFVIYMAPVGKQRDSGKG